ncbi:hypothetical protein TNCV_4777161 [Trichonephila clavipes]|nr:hypothetical protein TNCV_4777161 [Trichonephila clavipes]
MVPWPRAPVIPQLVDRKTFRDNRWVLHNQKPGYKQSLLSQHPYQHLRPSTFPARFNAAFIRSKYYCLNSTVCNRTLSSGNPAAARSTAGPPSRFRVTTFTKT